MQVEKVTQIASYRFTFYLLWVISFIKQLTKKN